ncbi:sprT domain-containing protein [Thiocystis minor]|uniref:SprT-like domain-containing protein n=1 Tax=Thiocystis minor TaxID=61597 RepID=UPI001912833D|nr:SprT-like domain-containing protein [Thiocystis minor]MBK5963900.1 sprT domain-containing protein [Thiocystis minor]
MNLTHAHALALQELARFPALHAWTFGWNVRKRAHGLCRYDRRRIELSAPLTEREPEVSLILNTIRHEIAHALAGPKTGHGPVWRHWADQVGCTRIASTRSSSEGATPIPPRYLLVALVDGRKQVVKTYHRRPSRGFIASLPHRHLRGRPETLGTLRLERLA